MYAQTFRLSKISRAAAPLGRDFLSLRRRCYSSGPTPGLADPVAYCKELVRKHDYESFLLAPFYPKDAQAGYYAIKAFAVGSFIFRCGSADVAWQVELAMVQDNVSNVTIGTMRMQFWRDALQGCAQVLFQL
jgi:NADH dehydrogenase [ubiquinone] 1 alpha subcomplex assembly factor 6